MRAAKRAEEIRAAELKECRFRPRITRRARELQRRPLGANAPPRPPTRAEREAEARAREKELAEIAACSFKPKICEASKALVKGCTRDRERSAERMSDAVVYRNGCIWMLRNEGGDVKR